MLQRNNQQKCVVRLAIVLGSFNGSRRGMIPV